MSSAAVNENDNPVPLGNPTLRKLAARLARSRFGRLWLGYLVLERPDLMLRALGAALSRDAGFSRLDDWPTRLAGFEDVAPLVLSSNDANRGIASMSLAELGHLWRLASMAGPTILVEIGRERGGSTFVLAAAMSEAATLYSYDPQTKQAALGEELDRQLGDALRRYRLDGRVHVLKADSHEAPLPDGRYGLVLVDGDPTYAGTRLDYERFSPRIEPGGHLLFHDAAPGGPRHRELARLMREIEGSELFERRADVGTFVHFVRRDRPERL